MITRAIFDFLLGLIPMIELPSEVLGASLEMLSWAAVVNYYVPVLSFVGCLASYLSVWLFSVILSAILKLL